MSLVCNILSPLSLFSNPRCLDALTMNSVCNIYEDDFAGLAEDDGASGNRKDNAISEYQSFVDLTFSKGKVISAIQWLPHRKVSACRKFVGQGSCVPAKAESHCSLLSDSFEKTSMATAVINIQVVLVLRLPVGTWNLLSVRNGLRLHGVACIEPLSITKRVGVWRACLSAMHFDLHLAPYAKSHSWFFPQNSGRPQGCVAVAFTEPLFFHDLVEVASVPKTCTPFQDFNPVQDMLQFGLCFKSPSLPRFHSAWLWPAASHCPSTSAWRSRACPRPALPCQI